MELVHADITQLAIKAFFQVYNDLGYGFLERVYQRSMAMATRGLGLSVTEQWPIHVHYGGTVVGEYFADMVVNDLVLIEIKAAKLILEEHEAQLLNYLKASRCEVGLLVNFGPKAEYRRKVFENSRKGNLSWLQS
jgi:GxxExxY protein